MSVLLVLVVAALVSFGLAVVGVPSRVDLKALGLFLLTLALLYVERFGRAGW